MPKSIALPRKLNNTKADVINSNLVHLRDGEVVLYKRENSGKWQARYKLKNRWQRISTKEKNISTTHVT